MVAKKGRRDSSDSSPIVEVGEIDTSAPFQSVKDAVNLFGEAAFSAEKPVFRKPNPQSAEKVLVKQTELHLAQKELNKLKEQLKNAETIREQALSELEWSKRTVDELTRKLEAVNESRDSANKATEAAKSLIEEAKPGNVSVASSSDAQTRDMEEYGEVCKELDTAKQELRKIRQVSNEILETKTVALSKVEEAKKVSKVHSEKIELLRKEIAAVNESVEQTKLACSQARKEQSEIFAEKEIQQKSYKAGMEESAKKSLALKNEFDPEFAKKLEVQLTETYNEIDELQKQMETAKASDIDSVNGVSLELNEAKGLFEKLVEEEKSLQELVESLKAELKNVKMEHDEVEAKEAEIESVAGDLHLKLSRSKSELEQCVTEESKAKAALEDMMLTINQISSETEAARREAEGMRNKAKELMKEAESAHLALEDSELHLRVALDEAEEAKAAETKALEQIKSMSEKTNAARNSTSSESGSQSITLSQEEFKSLSKRAEVFDKLAEMKVAAALAQVEAVRASENETLKCRPSLLLLLRDHSSSFRPDSRRGKMAGCAMNLQFSSVVKVRNEISSFGICNRDFVFRDLAKAMKVPVLRIRGGSGRQRSRLFVVNMSQSPIEPQSGGFAATEQIKGEGDNSILGKDNVRNLGTDQLENLDIDGNVGDGFNGSDGNGGGGGGGNGGEGDGEGEDYEEKEFGPILKFEEVMKETEARGATLPSDMLEAAKNYGIRKVLLLRYLDLQSSAGLLGFAIRSWAMLRNRMLADPSFLFKIGAEIVIDSCCATVAEVQKRGKDFWAEFELYVADLLVGTVVNIALVGMLAPYVRFGQPSASPGFLGRMVFAYNALPSSVFEAERPGCRFSAQQRLATYFYKGIMYGAVGFGCGIVGQGIANLIMTAKRNINKSEENIPVPPLIKSAALWGVFLSVSSNTRYQIINGLERVVEASPFAKKFPPAAMAFTVGVRLANNIYGGMQFVDWARLSGCQ